MSFGGPADSRVDGKECRRQLARIAPALGLLLIAARGVRAQQEIPLNLVDGKPCARCTVHYGGKSIPANVVMDLGLRVPLVVHVRTSRLLQIEPKKGVEIRFKDIALKNLEAVSADVTALATLTRDYASELGEVPVVGMIGLPAFADFAPQLDLGRGVLRVLSAEEGMREVGQTLGQSGDKTSPAWTFAYKEEGHGIWLPGTGPGNYAMRVLFRTSEYDTQIDATTADLAGAPGGELDALLVGSLNLAKYVALRPVDLSSAQKPRPDVVIGTGLLQHFRLTVDLANRRMRWEQTRKPAFPSEERQYFVAVVDGNADAVEAFLKAHPDSRLGDEASRKLIELRLKDDPVASDDFEQAVALRADRSKPNRRATALLELADQLLASDRSDKYALAKTALSVGLKYAPKGLDATAAHRIQARLGRVAYVQGDLKQARRHLLSAAFGMPRDPTTNLWMGELYERMGKRTRAWSRYVQAAISKDVPIAAVQGLDRLNGDPNFRATFTMADAEQLMEGRIVEFHPPRRYDEDRAKFPGHVRLVELFTCIDHPLTQAPELALAGLAEYFSDAQVAVVQYHLAAPKEDPLVTSIAEARARYYQIKTTPAALFDGQEPISTGGGGAEQAGKLFAAYRQASVKPEADKNAWRLDGGFTSRGRTISGRVTPAAVVTGDAARLHVILCERMVMVPGANGLVLHRYVARASGTPLDGFAVPVSQSTEKQSFEVRFDLSKVSGELVKTIAATEKAKKIRFSMRPTYIDSGQAAVVAFLQDPNTRKVLAARRFELKAEDQVP